MHCCDIVGWLCEGEIWCTDCVVEPDDTDGGDTPVFVEDEHPWPGLHCSGCGEPIEVAIVEPDLPAKIGKIRLDRLGSLRAWLAVVERMDGGEDQERFELAQGLYWGCNDSVYGQGSIEYRALSRISRDYRPARSENGPDNDLARAVYNAIVEGSPWTE